MADDWEKCIQHVMKVEDKFLQLDCTIGNAIESFVINVNDSNCRV